MSDGIGLAEVLLGLPGFRVLDVAETDHEVIVSIESTAVQAFCQTCGVRAEPQDRMRVDVRDLACFGRPARLVWRTVDAIWYLAGDSATDFNYYTKRGLLAGVYGATLLTWLDDRSPGFAETWSFLDRRLDDALRIPRLMADATRWVTPVVPGLLRPGRPAR